MKEMIFKQNTDVNNKVKAVSSVEKIEDKNCITYIEKKFILKLSSTDQVAPKKSQPEFNLIKSFDTKKQIERFRFESKGYFFMTNNRMLVKINYKHSLRIKIVWKTKNVPLEKVSILKNKKLEQTP